MKKQNTFRLLAVVLSVFAGFALANAQDNNKTAPADKQRYYEQQKRKADASKMTPTSEERNKMELNQKFNSNKLAAVKGNFKSSAPLTKPAADRLQQLQQLKAIAAQKGLSTAKYDEAILQLTNPKN